LRYVEVTQLNVVCYFVNLKMKNRVGRRVINWKEV